MSTNLKTVKEKSVVGFNALCVWISDVINKTTGYDQITEIEKHVNESERKFEYTTKQLRELNAEYLNHEQQVMDLQLERSELLMKPKRTAEENKRLAELVANENEWEMPLENVKRSRMSGSLFELQKRQLEEYKDDIYKRYYEERAWEQKIRRLGQYSYIAMLGLNLLMFFYTRYDRKRIRQNLEYTIDTNNALSKQIAEIKQSQQEIYEENKLLLTGVHNSIHNLGDTSDIETKSEAVAVDASSLEEQKQTVLEVSKYLTEVKPALQRTEDSTTVALHSSEDRVQTNAIIYVLSSIATFAIMSLMTH
ncbi:hypothetical protein JH06_4018 [Blastocystis sp. subtype 4]|uniref:hypothetical protein n=1 Tax=Blastocystis sp. subtype 4 TaxID=944170 RepID=UPI00071206C4|nr:hypothetical protein JH06_4018 [Blastocystis sp. subtype 4]KNB42411.1 hypothetical protein JH06_4018 [Blastocystis sp. subtype 4]|eukprot:XP_014525849.1 hypothetical protein JH06_4018 [Blastocystis sp. subtype 4]